MGVLRAARTQVRAVHLWTTDYTDCKLIRLIRCLFSEEPDAQGQEEAPRLIHRSLPIRARGPLVIGIFDLSKKVLWSPVMAGACRFMYARTCKRAIRVNPRSFLLGMPHYTYAASSTAQKKARNKSRRTGAPRIRFPAALGSTSKGYGHPFDSLAVEKPEIRFEMILRWRNGS